MRVLGAILAGGKAQRFGSDKAHALWQGERLIERVAAALGPQCEALVVCGREEPGFTSLPDRPEAGLGPLGGLNAALHHAHGNGFDVVLASACDIPDIPPDLLARLEGEGAAIIADQPVVGLWPASLAPVLDQIIADGGRAIYRLADRVNARRISIAPALGNINRPEDIVPSSGPKARSSADSRDGDAAG